MTDTVEIRRMFRHAGLNITSTDVANLDPEFPPGQIGWLQETEMKWEVMKRERKYLLMIGLAGVLATTGTLIWNAGNRPEVQTDDADAVRTRAVKLIAGTLDEIDRWLANLPNAPDPGTLLAGIRYGFRPYFQVLSMEFDSQLICIIRAVDAQIDDSGPMRDHSLQLVLVSIRALLEEERNRLADRSIQREDVNRRLVRLTPSMLMGD